MALSTVTLQWDLADLIQSGIPATLSITPTAQMSDTADHILIPPVARTWKFTGGTGTLAGIVANDNASILPAGTGYLISVTDENGRVIVPQFQTQILTANGSTQWLDRLAVVPAVTTSYQYLPLPSGTPAAGQVPVATGVGEASAWTTPAVVTLPLPTGVAATDTAAIQSAENALNAAGGGVLRWQPGIYMTTGLVKKAAVIWQGAGRFATTVKLANGSNADLVQGDQFGTLTLSGSATGGIGGWGIRDMTLDGNQAGQTGTSYGLRVYGYEFDLSNITIRNCLTDCMYTEWGNFGGSGTPGGTMESTITGVKLYDAKGNGWHNRGPHDTRVFDMTIFWENVSPSASSVGYWPESLGNVAYTVAAGSNGVNVSTFAGAGTLNVNTTLAWPAASISATQGSITVATSGGTAVITYTGTTAQSFTGCTTVSGTGTLSTGGSVTPTGGGYSANGCLLYGVHVWGIPLVDFQLDAQTHLVDCIGEAVQSGGSMIFARADSVVTGGEYFIVHTAPQVGCGLKLGDTVNPAGNCRIDTYMTGFAGTSAATAAVNIVSDGGNNAIDVLVFQASGQAVFGTPQQDTRLRVHAAGSGSASADAANSRVAVYGTGYHRIPNANQAWRLVQTGAADWLNVNTGGAQGRLEHVGGLLDRWYSDQYSTVTAEIDGTTGRMSAAYLAPTGLTGATQAGRYVGTVSGAAPVTGTFSTGDWAGDRTSGGFWVCVSGGTSGTWVYVGGNANLQLALAPTGAKGQSFDRALATVYLASLASGTVYVTAMPLRQGVTVSNLATTIGGTAFSGVTHGWYALLDSSMTVRAVTADQTGGNWGSSFSQVSLAATASYTPPADGLYYFAFCAVFTGSGQIPALAGAIGGASNFAPALQGTSSTGQSTPPSLGATLAAVAAVNTDRFYAYVS